MTNATTRKIIEEAMPNARIIERPDINIDLAADVTVTVTPSTEEMLRKWGKRPFLRSGAGYQVVTADIKNVDSSDLDVEVVELMDSSLPLSLRRRTVVVDKKNRKIVSTSG